MSIATLLSHTGIPDADLADGLGVTREMIRLVKNGSRVLSPKNAIKASELTGIPRGEFRPDIWPDQRANAAEAVSV